MKILEILENHGNKQGARHVSAEDVYKHLLANGEDIGLATVYRVLTQFEAAGMVNRHHFEGGHSVFELAGEHHHDHIVCSQCGHIEEFVDESIEARQHSIAKERGFELREHCLILYGNCVKENCPHR